MCQRLLKARSGISLDTVYFNIYKSKLIFNIKNESTTAHKKIGVNPDVYYYMLPIAAGGYHGLFLEFKRPGGKLSDKQVCKIALLREQGYKCDVVYGWEEGIKAVLDYLKNSFL